MRLSDIQNVSLESESKGGALLEATDDGGSGGMIEVWEDCKNIHIRGLRLDSGEDNLFRYCIRTRDCEDLYVIDNEVRNAEDDDIAIEDRTDGFWVLRNRSYGGFGEFGFSAAIEIEGGARNGVCAFNKATGVNEVGVNCAHHGEQEEDTFGVIIYGNIIDIEASGISGIRVSAAEDSLGQMREIVVSENEISGVTTGVVVRTSQYVNLSGNIVRNAENRSYRVLADSEFINFTGPNISIDHEQRALQAEDGTRDCYFSHLIATSDVTDSDGIRIEADIGPDNTFIQNDVRNVDRTPISIASAVDISEQEIWGNKGFTDRTRDGIWTLIARRGEQIDEGQSYVEDTSDFRHLMFRFASASNTGSTIFALRFNEEGEGEGEDVYDYHAEDATGITRKNGETEIELLNNMLLSRTQTGEYKILGDDDEPSIFGNGGGNGGQAYLKRGIYENEIGSPDSLEFMAIDGMYASKAKVQRTAFRYGVPIGSDQRHTNRKHRR